MVHKVFAYITRQGPSGTDLLVFRHRDHPDAGVQVPGGTVEDGEAFEAAALREAFEESGLSGFRTVRDLGHYSHTRHEGDAPVERHFFHMESAEGVPDAFEHVVSSGTDDEGLVFVYSWIPLDQANGLAGEQGKFANSMSNGGTN